MDHQDFVDVLKELQHAQLQILFLKKPRLIVKIQLKKLYRQTITITTFLTPLLLKKSLSNHYLLVTLTYQLSKLVPVMCAHQMFWTYFVLTQLRRLQDMLFAPNSPTTSLR